VQVEVFVRVEVFVGVEDYVVNLFLLDVLVLLVL
jgi:hypothetical protein